MRWALTHIYHPPNKHPQASIQGSRFSFQLIPSYCVFHFEKSLRGLSMTVGWIETPRHLSTKSEMICGKHHHSLFLEPIKADYARASQIYLELTKRSASKFPHLTKPTVQHSPKPNQSLWNMQNSIHLRNNLKSRRNPNCQNNTAEPISYERPGR